MSTGGVPGTQKHLAGEHVVKTWVFLRDMKIYSTLLAWKKEIKF